MTYAQKMLNDQMVRRDLDYWNGPQAKLDAAMAQGRLTAQGQLDPFAIGGYSSNPKRISGEMNPYVQAKGINPLQFSRQAKTSSLADRITGNRNANAEMRQQQNMAQQNANAIQAIEVAKAMQNQKMINDYRNKQQVNDYVAQNPKTVSQLFDKEVKRIIGGR